MHFQVKYFEKNIWQFSFQQEQMTGTIICTGEVLFFDILLPYKFDAKSFLESLILAQSERWRRGLGMQVERSRKG